MEKMRVEMVRQFRVFRAGGVYDVPAGKGRALVKNGFAKETDEDIGSPEMVTTRRRAESAAKARAAKAAKAAKAPTKDKKEPGPSRTQVTGPKDTGEKRTTTKKAKATKKKTAKK